MAREPDPKNFVETVLAELGKTNASLEELKKRIPEKAPEGSNPPAPIKKEKGFFESLLFGDDE